MSKHKHDWLTQYFVFPEEDENYELDEPYEVQYCSDRDCGQRKVLAMSEDLAKNVREFNGLTEEGGE